MIFCGLQEEMRNIFHQNPKKKKKLIIKIKNHNPSNKTTKTKTKTHNGEKYYLHCKLSKSILRL